MLRTVTVKNGMIRGLPAADPRITSFKGIPFAAPPVGENRWRAPQPASDWEGVFRAFEFGPISLQAPTGVDQNDIYTREWAVDPDIPMSEDCLYLNVWTPARSPDERLPVFVWYFGGGLQVGNTAEMEFDGERIARRGIVVVTLNYRLNVFGFLCHPGISKEAPEAPANFGHLDQLAGTQWVKRNIAAFGGDPDNITIGGQSAGGGSVLAQIGSPQAEGLFQKAIIQSGLMATIYPNERRLGMYQSLAEAEQEGVKFFEFLGASSLAAARRLEARYVLDKALEYRRFWGTVVDNVYCLGNGLERLVQNQARTVPLLCGHTSSEFFSTPRVNDMDELKSVATQMFGEDAEHYLAVCGVESSSFDEAVKAASVSRIEYAIRIIGRAHAENGRQIPLYYYNFDAEIPGWDNPGTFHSVDLWFFFETLAKCWRPFTGKHYDLARQMCNYWSNFIRCGDPNGPDATGDEMPRWDPYTPEAPFAMVFGDQAEFSREQPSPLMQFLVDHYFKEER